jgi:RNA polymerase sigma-70 factor (ECF subfamily)
VEEKELVQQAAAGDRSAFEQLVVRYQIPIYNLTLRMVGNEDDAFDLAQEAFLRAWRGLPDFRTESSFSTWLYRLASNVCIDFLRQKKRSKIVSLNFVDADEEEQTMEFPDPSPSPETQSIQADERSRIEQALNELEPEYRETLTLCALHGLSYIEIAEIMDVPAGTVKSRLSRAREKMRKKLLQSGNKSDSHSSTKREKGASAT